MGLHTPHSKSNPTVYVLGFAFDFMKFGQSVCLIEKEKPDWQKGHLNGVGGKVESHEAPEQAIEREFHEETGVLIEADDWIKFFVMRFANGAVVHCFTTMLPDSPAPRTMETEEVGLWTISERGQYAHAMPIISNLNWLIPMAYHELRQPVAERMLIE